MIRKQRVLLATSGVVSLFAGGFFCKCAFKLSPLIGCLLLLYGTLAIVESITAASNKNEHEYHKVGEVVEKDGPVHGCLLVAIGLGTILTFLYVESIREKLGFSIVGVAIIGFIFWGVNHISGKK